LSCSVRAVNKSIDEEEEELYQQDAGAWSGVSLEITNILPGFLRRLAVAPFLLTEKDE
jgi:hypothetical protein